MGVKGACPLGLPPPLGERGGHPRNFHASSRKLEGHFYRTKISYYTPDTAIPKSIITKQKRNAMQQCHARFYYYCREGYHQEVPESYPEHPFDRGFHFSFGIVFTTVRAIWQPLRWSRTGHVCFSGYLSVKSCRRGESLPVNRQQPTIPG